jgi:hypothetical protein
VFIILANGHVVAVDVACWVRVIVLHSHDVEERLYVFWRGAAEAIGSSCHFDAGVLPDGVLDCDIPELDELLSKFGGDMKRCWSMQGSHLLMREAERSLALRSEECAGYGFEIQMF